MNGWFPRINARGDVVSGAGEIFFNDRSLGPGHGPDFVTDDVVVFSRPTGPQSEETIVLDTRDGAVLAAVPIGYNRYVAGGGRWTGFRATAPSTMDLCAGATVVRTWQDAALPVMAPGGRYAFVRPYQSEARTVFLGEGDRDPVAVFAGAVMNLTVSDRAIVLQVATGKYTRQVIGARDGEAFEDWTILEWEDPIVCDGPNGAAWVLSVTQTGLILRPAGARLGYAWPGEWFNPAIKFIGGRFVIAASDDAGRRKLELVDPAGARVLLVKPDRQPGPINTDDPPALPPPPPLPPTIPPTTPTTTTPTPTRPRSLRSHRKGLHMEIDGKIVVLRGPGGLLIAPDAPNTGTWRDLKNRDNQPANWRGAAWGGASSTGDPRHHHRATKVDGDRYTFTQVGNRGLAGADATKHSGSIPEQFYYKPDGDTDAGPYEQWRVYDGNENGAVQAQIEYSNDEGKYFSCALAVEVVS